MEHSPSESASSDPREWVHKHGDALFGFALRHTGDRSSAEDLVQETFLAALKARSSFAGSSSERTWLIGILKHKMMDHFRRCGREVPLDRPESISESDESDYIAGGPDAGAWQPNRRPKPWTVDADDPVEQKQFWEHLRRCLNDLDQRLAQVYTMRDIHQIGYDEVCNVLSVTPTNLRVMLHRARKLLRRCLEINWVHS
ncbi:MAG: sigma-70 family RNA polymerase sigma factor [Candidatus Zixiibacteriota bacterium]